jgi:DNA-binding TFAR19-related protein (PDSD5 family)
VLPCTVAAKLTSQLQLTDTDFSKDFKSHCRSEMDRLRVEWEAEQSRQGLREVFRPGAKEILQTVAFAHEQLAIKNLSHK